MLRPLATNPVTAAVLCGLLCVSLFLLHARVALGENVVGYLLTAREDAAVTAWAVFYELGGVCLLGVVPLLLYARYGVITPAVVVVVLSAGYLYLADAQVPYLFMIWTPQFVSAVFAVGTVEYLLRTAVVGTTTLSGGLETALSLGVLHAVVITAALGELSLEFVLLSLGTVYVVAVPALLFLEFGAVGPAAGVVAGLAFVVVVHGESLQSEFPFVLPRVLVPLFLFGGVEYLLRSADTVGA